MVTFSNIILYAAAIAAVGSRLVIWLDHRRRLSGTEKIAIAAAGGSIVVGFAALAGAVITSNLLFGIYLAVGLSITICGPRLISASRSIDLKRLHIAPYQLVLFLFWLILMGVVGQVLITDQSGFPQGTLTGWGDVAYHMSMIGHLALGAPFQLDQPIAAGMPLTYPFFVNFFSAVLVRLGMPFLWAWYVPMVLFGTMLLILLFSFARRILESRWFAVMLVALVIFGGGIGWYVFTQDIYHAWTRQGWDGVQQTLDRPPHQYTHLDNRTGGKPKGADVPLNIVWITPAISFFSHQRSFAPGFTLALVILIGWILYGNGPPDDQRTFARWLLLLGFLPLTHSHTALAMGVLFVVLTLQRMIQKQAVRMWFAGAGGAFIIALPQLLHFASAMSGTDSAMFTSWFGWMTCIHTASWLLCPSSNILGTLSGAVVFWEKNFGIVAVGWLFAGLWYFIFRRREKQSALRQLVLPSLALFIVPNLFKIQPWEFDNNKVLMYWWLLASLLSVALIRSIVRSWPRYAKIAFAVAVLLISCTAGLVDISTRIRDTWSAWHDRPVADHAGYYGPYEVAAAQWIMEHTKPQDAFLTTDGPNNFVPMLTGRPLFLGYPGWLWTQGNGSIITERKAAANTFFATRNPKPLCSRGVRWVMWEPALLQTYPDASSTRPDQLGRVRFGQNIPNGQRFFVELPCS